MIDILGGLYLHDLLSSVSLKQVVLLKNSDCVSCCNEFRMKNMHFFITLAGQQLV